MLLGILVVLSVEDLTDSRGGSGARGVGGGAGQEGAGHRVDGQHRGTFVQSRPIQGARGGTRFGVRLLDVPVLVRGLLVLAGLRPAAAGSAAAEKEKTA